MADVTAILEGDGCAGREPCDVGDGAEADAADLVAGCDAMDPDAAPLTPLPEEADGPAAARSAGSRGAHPALRSTALAALLSVAVHAGVAAGAYVLSRQVGTFTPARVAFGWGDGAASTGIADGTGAIGPDGPGPAALPRYGPAGTAVPGPASTLTMDASDGQPMPGSEEMPPPAHPPMPRVAVGSDGATTPWFGPPGGAVMDAAPPFRPPGAAGAAARSDAAAGADAADGGAGPDAPPPIASTGGAPTSNGGLNAAGSGATGAGGGGTGRPGVPAGTRNGRLPRPVYPPLSRRLGEEGAVLLEVEVRADGSLGRITVLSDGGFPRLAEAAIAAVQRTPFTPARDNGRPVASHLRIPFRFTLRGPPARG